MADETLDLGHLYDGVDVNELGGGHLYDEEPVKHSVPDTLMYKDKVIVQPMRLFETPYGAGTMPDGDVSWCYCSVETRTQKNSVFSKNWAQDTTPQNTGGLRQEVLVKVLAPEWHGDIHTMFWYRDDLYEVDGPPALLPHGSEMSKHWEVTGRCIGHINERGIKEPPMPAEGSRIWGT